MDMSLMRIGTLGAYIKNMEKAAMWQMKKESGDLTSHKMSLDEWLEETRADTVSITERIEEQKEKDDPDVQAIYYKVQTGKKLTQEEMEYLQQNDPETYAKALSIQQERKAYERELKQCKTQEDVQRLKMTKLGESLSMVNEISNNPNIPLEKKLEYAMMENARVTAITEETEKFIKSGEYEKLPTEAEQKEAMEEMREDKGIVPEVEENAASEEQKQASEAAVQTDRSASQRMPEMETEAPQTTPEMENEAPQPMVELSGEDANDTTESDAEKKVRRARAKAAYGAVSPEQDDTAMLTAKVQSFSRSV